MRMMLRYLALIFRRRDITVSDGPIVVGTCGDLVIMEKDGRRWSERR